MLLRVEDKEYAMEGPEKVKRLIVFDILFWEDSDGEIVFLPDVTVVRHPYTNKPDDNRTGIKRRGGNWETLHKTLKEPELEAFKQQWKLAKVFALTCPKV